MKQCPKLTPDNYLLGEEPIPLFDAQGEEIFEPDGYSGGITFTPPSAPTGASFDIALDGFPPGETVQACWYFPSTKLENCINLELGADGHADTVYFSETSYPKGIYKMEVENSGGTISQEFSLE